MLHKFWHSEKDRVNFCKSCGVIMTEETMDLNCPPWNLDKIEIINECNYKNLRNILKSIINNINKIDIDFLDDQETVHITKVHALINEGIKILDNQK